MLKHRIVTVIYIASVILIFLLSGIGTVFFYLLISVITVAYLSIEFAGAYYIGLNFHLNSVNHLDETKKQIALTFDDGPHHPNTLKTLDTLSQHNVKATFFLIGRYCKENEQIVNRIHQEGHAIGSHSFSHHFWIDMFGKAKLEEDIKQSLTEIKQITGHETRLFRPPYGVTTPNFTYVLKKLNLQSIGWNVRSYDTSTPDLNKIFDKVIHETKNGSVILLHDRLEIMPELLNKLIPALKEKGFEFITITA